MKRAFSNILHGQQDERGWPLVGVEPAGVERDHPSAQRREVLRHLEILNRGFIGQNIFENRAQGGNIPLSLSQLIQKAPFSSARRQLERLIKGPARRADTKVAVQDQKRFPDGGENPLRIQGPENRLIGGRCELPKRGYNPRVFGVERPGFVGVRDNPDCADRFACHMKGNEQRFVNPRLDLGKVRKVPVQMRHQLDSVGIEDSSAGAEFAGRRTAKVRCVFPGKAVPAENLPAILLLKQADPRRLSPAQIQRCLNQLLQDLVGRIRQGLSQRYQGAGERLKLRLSRGAKTQFPSRDNGL